MNIDKLWSEQVYELVLQRAGTILDHQQPELVAIGSFGIRLGALVRRKVYQAVFMADAKMDLIKYQAAMHCPPGEGSGLALHKNMLISELAIREIKKSGEIEDYEDIDSL